MRLAAVIASHQLGELGERVGDIRPIDHAVAPGQVDRPQQLVSTIEIALTAGRDMIFDVDWQGGARLSERWPSDSLKIFILPPDQATLEARLRQRATDAPDVIERRLREAKVDRKSVV